MLQKLRKRFVLIAVSLTMIVLICTLGFSLLSQARSLYQMASGSLNRAILGQMDVPPNVVTSMGQGQDAEPDPSGLTHMITAICDVSSSGTVLRSNSDFVTIGDAELERVIQAALESQEDSGHLSDICISWKRATTSFGYRIAVVSTEAIDETIRAQVITDIFIVIGASAAVFGIAWYLATVAVEPIEASWEQQRRFIADASHELKTPLAVIMANMQILNGDRKNIPEEDIRWVDVTMEEASNMLDLVNEMLELARADTTASGQIGGAYNMVDLDFSALVENVTLQFDSVAFERGCMLESSIDEGLHVTGDSAALERLIKTFLDNACKYAEKGSTVTVSLHREKDMVTYSVNNHGTPIDHEDLEHVFERFYRSDKARTRTNSGSYGLGLAIAKGIVDAHHGDVQVESDLEHGTTFSASLSAVQ